MGVQQVGHDLVTEQQQICVSIYLCDIMMYMILYITYYHIIYALLLFSC